MKVRNIVIVSAIAAVSIVGVIIWQVYERQAEASRLEAEIIHKLTPEDLELLVRSQKGVYETVAATPESKQNFLKGLREYLALAAAARREGLHGDPRFKANFAFKRRNLIAEIYAESTSQPGTAGSGISEEDIAAIWSDAKNETLFASEMEAIRAIQLEQARQRGQPDSAVPPLAAGSLEKARRNWARSKLLYDRAEADPEFMSRRDLSLRVKVLEAGILSSDYLRKHWPDQIRPTENERSDYLAAHPELDVAKKLQTARSILERARSGEELAKLAAQFSEDRTTKEKGGLYTDVSANEAWAEVVAALSGLKEGEIAPRVIESHAGFHIAKLEKRKTVRNSDGSETETVDFRHVLLQRKFPDPQHDNPEIPAPFISAEEIAEKMVEMEKRDRFVAEIVARNPIELPADV